MSAAERIRARLAANKSAGACLLALSPPSWTRIGPIVCCAARSWPKRAAQLAHGVTLGVRPPRDVSLLAAGAAPGSAAPSTDTRSELFGRGGSSGSLAREDSREMSRGTADLAPPVPSSAPAPRAAAAAAAPVFEQGPQNVATLAASNCPDTRLVFTNKIYLNRADLARIGTEHIEVGQHPPPPFP